MYEQILFSCLLNLQFYQLQEYRYFEILINIQMSQTDSLEFRNKSISQLVQELNSLGDDHVNMHQTTLIAVQQADYPSVRRFRSKSTSRYTSGEHQAPQNSRQSKKQKTLQFFLTDNSQKKYYYHQIINELETMNIATILSKFEQGFNTSILMEFNDYRFKQIIQKISPWFDNVGKCEQKCLAYFVDFGNKEAIDILNQSGRKVISLEEGAHENHPFYQIKLNDLIKKKQLKEKGIKILKLARKSSANQLRIIMLPEKFLQQKSDDPTQKIIKSQLNQILNYIKTNPNKRYEKINSLLPKRFPTVSAIAELLLTDSANYIVNWILDQKENRNLVNGRFQFYDKLSSIVNFIRKVPENQKINRKRIISKPLTKNANKSPYKAQSITSVHLNTMQTEFKKSRNNQTTNPLKDQTQLIKGQTASYPKSMNQLEYCRQFQRKTHKYSISEFQSFNNEEMSQKNEFIFNNDVELFPETLNRQQNNHINFTKIKQQCTESEAIILLKAQHAREISQYHETIQNLNKKILILTSQKGLEELYTIHEREIMHLQLKIEQLRNDISKLCQPTTKNDKSKDKELKTMIRKLNEEIIVLQKSNPTYKISKGKIKMLEKQVQDWKSKYQAGQLARGQLANQIKALTNRLKIQQKLAYEQKANRETLQLKDEELCQLAPKQQQAYRQLIQLTKNRIENKQKQKYLLRKCKNILSELSETREIVLDCNNFLVDLQEQLQAKLGEKDPEVVLDCNRFIRSYLLDNLDIF